MNNGCIFTLKKIYVKFSQRTKFLEYYIYTYICTYIYTHHREQNFWKIYIIYINKTPLGLVLGPEDHKARVVLF
jgi:hypothetical protein